MEVTTDLEMMSFGEHQMSLFDKATGTIVVQAIRNPETGLWTISDSNELTPDIEVATFDGADQPRMPAIQAMVQHAVDSSPHTGFSAKIPPGLPERP